MQRFVYVIAKNYHTDDPNKGTPDPNGMNQSQKFQNATGKF